MFLNKVLEETDSKINGQIKVIRSLGFGTYIQVDNLTQSGGIINEIWRGIFRKIKNQKSNVKNCLILGLGGGTVAKLIHKTWPEAKITGVDLDPVMVEMGQKYLGLEKIPLQIKIMDASKFKSQIKFDLIIIDLYVGREFPEKFTSDAFLRLTQKLLSPKGTVIFNRLYFDRKRSEAVKFGNKLKKYFKQVDFVYPQANLLLVCTSSAKI